MRPDIINSPVLEEKINEILDYCSPSLTAYLPKLRACFRKALERHDSIRKAHRRKDDPPWAKNKFENGHTLYRFDPKRLDDWEVEGVLSDLAKLAEIIPLGGVVSDEAKAFFRGLPHQKICWEEIGRNAHNLNHRSSTAKRLSD